MAPFRKFSFIARHPKFVGRLTTNTDGRSIKPKEEGHQKACHLGAEAFSQVAQAEVDDLSIANLSHLGGSA